MTWDELEPHVRAVAESVCTAKQLEALKLWEDGLGYGRISLLLRISPSSARDRVRRALNAIDLAMETAA